MSLLARTKTPRKDLGYFNMSVAWVSYKILLFNMIVACWVSYNRSSTSDNLLSMLQLVPRREFVHTGATSLLITTKLKLRLLY